MTSELEVSGVEQQLLIAALVLGLTPSIELYRANSARVVNQVLSWRGMTKEQIDSGWRDDDCDPEHKLVYSALVKLIHTNHDEVLLFEGAGNWGVPSDPDRPACHPQFNSCRLTAEGEKLAVFLLEQHPEDG